MFLNINAVFKVVTLLLPKIVPVLRLFFLPYNTDRTNARQKSENSTKKQLFKTLNQHKITNL